MVLSFDFKSAVMLREAMRRCHEAWTRHISGRRECGSLQRIFSEELKRGVRTCLGAAIPMATTGLKENFWNTQRTICNRSIKQIVQFALLVLSPTLCFAQDIQKEIQVIQAISNTSQKSQSDTLKAGQDLTSLSAFIDTTLYKDLSLDQVIELAVQHNRILKTLQISGQSANIRLKQAEYRFLPSGYVTGARNESRNYDLGYVIKKTGLSSTIGLSRALETGGAVSLSLDNSTNVSSNLAGVTNYNSNLGITISQPLMQGAGIKINLLPIAIAKNYAKASLLDVKQNLINLITTIDSQYWDLILVYEDLKIQQAALKRAKELLEINKSLIESGRMAAQEIVQTESDIATREIAVAGAEDAIINTQIALLAQLDLGTQLLIRPTTKMEFKPVEVDWEDCLRRAYENRPDWLSYQLYLDIERMQMLQARNNNRYNLGSWARIGSDATTTQDVARSLQEVFGFKTLAWNIGLSFTFPFNQQVLENGYILNKLSYERFQLYTEELKDNIRIAVESAVRRVQYTLKQVGLAQRAKDLALKKLTLEEDKMKVGRSSNFQVISYQRDLINAQNEELRAIASYLKALGQLEQTMGTTLQKWGIEVDEIR